MTDKVVNIGDWVTSYSAGIWRVSNVVNTKGYDAITNEIRDISVVISDRFLNDSFKRSFSREACSPSWIDPIEKKSMEKLEKFIAENPEIVKVFDGHTFRDVFENCDLWLGLDGTVAEEEAMDNISAMDGVSASEVKSFCESSGFEVGVDGGFRIRICSWAYEEANGELLYTYDQRL